MKIGDFLRQFRYRRSSDLGDIEDPNERIQETEMERINFETLGYLAASIEHDLRNPLAVIESEIYRMSTKFQGYPDVLSGLWKIEEQTRRIYDAASIIPIIRENREFYRSDMQKTHVDEIISRSVKALKAEIRTERVFFKQDDSKGLYIDTNPILLQRALVNIFRNSVEAIFRSGRKTGNISIRSRPSDDHFFISIDIDDNGDGIAEEDITKLTTLFTTKKKGLPNRGIGLFITDRIISIHGGKMEISSEVGHGTRVSILLPRSEDRKHRGNIDFS